MRLYLIRHGKTLANERHLYCGATQLPLTEAGIAELQTRKAQMPAPGRARFLTSGMLRTEQTLELLFGDVPHTRDERFREVNFGAFEMHSYEELKERPDYQAWISGDNDANIPPGGESGNQMRERVLSGLKELLNREEDVVLVTHGGTIAIIMEALFPGEGKNRYTWQPRPCYGYLIEKTLDRIVYDSI